MKVLYIPISSQNFNNIFSSESISPAAFYSVRGFGYSRWTSIPENPFANATVLYEEFRSFERHNSEYEDHPVVFEVAVNDDFVTSLIQISPGIYLCNKTIYLNPFSVRVHFFSEEDRRIVLSMSESSIETKMIRLYSKRMVISNRTDAPYVLPEDIAESPVQLNQEEIAKDIKLNKMKGLLYGYYIGSKLSSSREDLAKLQILREIQNIFAAILSSVDGRETALQVEQLTCYFNTLNKETELYQSVLNLCKDEHVTDAVFDVFRRNQGGIKGELHPYMFIPTLTAKSGTQASDNSSISWIERQILEQLQKMNLKASFPSPADEPIVIVGTEFNTLKSESLDEESLRLFRHWVNGVLSSGKYNGKIGPLKNDLSDDVTREAKALIGDEWDYSQEKSELNAIRKFVRGEAYEHVWGNDIYSDIAAILTKGDDWETLLRFLQSKMISDCSIPFALYGVLNGFANLPRDFVDVLLNSDRSFIADVYKEFHGQLFSESPENLPALSTTHHPVQIIEQNEDSLVKDDVNKLETPDSSTIETHKPEVDDQEFDTFWSKLSKACRGVAPDKNAYLKHYNEFGLSKEFLEAVDNDHTINKGKMVQTTARKSIEAQVKAKEKQIQKDAMDVSKSTKTANIVKNQSSLESNSLFNDEDLPVFIPSGIRFSLKYLQQIVEIARIMNPGLNEKALSTFMSDLKWVFDTDYLKGKNEIEFLEAFSQLLEKSKCETISKKGLDMRWKVERYAPLDIAKTIAAIKQACNL